jgi:hypothetical protein
MPNPTIFGSRDCRLVEQSALRISRDRTPENQSEICGDLFYVVAMAADTAL